jgi:hypothetical protein
MDTMTFIDEHERRLDADAAQVWRAVSYYASTSLGIGRRHPLRWILRPEPASGFVVTERRPNEVLVVGGRHRFASYRIEFVLADAGPNATLLRLRSYAAFPGLLGWAYRGAVVGSRGHVVAVRAMLRAIERELIRNSSASADGEPRHAV